MTESASPSISILALNDVMQDYFRECVVKRALCHRDKASPETRRWLARAIHQHVKVDGYKHPGNAPTERLVLPVKRASINTEDLMTWLLQCWVESHETLAATVCQFATERGLMFKDRHEISHGFVTEWPVTEMTAVAYEFAQINGMAEWDDVALMLCCVTGRAPRPVPDDVAPAPAPAGAAGMQPGQPSQADVLQPSNLHDCDADGPAPRGAALVTCWDAWLEQLQALPPEAVEWDAAEPFVISVQQLTASKLQERASRRGMMRQALAALQTGEAGQELAYFEYAGVSDWNVETYPLALAPELAETLQNFEVLLIKHQARRLKPPATRAEEKERSKQLDSLAVEIEAAYRNIQLELAAPSLPSAPTELRAPEPEAPAIAQMASPVETESIATSSTEEPSTSDFPHEDTVLDISLEQPAVPTPTPVSEAEPLVAGAALPLFDRTQPIQENEPALEPDEGTVVPAAVSAEPFTAETPLTDAAAQPARLTDNPPEEQHQAWPEIKDITRQANHASFVEHFPVTAPAQPAALQPTLTEYAAELQFSREEPAAQRAIPRPAGQPSSAAQVLQRLQEMLAQGETFADTTAVPEPPESPQPAELVKAAGACLDRWLGSWSHLPKVELLITWLREHASEVAAAYPSGELCEIAYYAFQPAGEPRVRRCPDLTPLRSALVANPPNEIATACWHVSAALVLLQGCLPAWELLEHRDWMNQPDFENWVRMAETIDAYVRQGSESLPEVAARLSSSPSGPNPKQERAAAQKILAELTRPGGYHFLKGQRLSALMDKELADLHRSLTQDVPDEEVVQWVKHFKPERQLDQWAGQVEPLTVDIEGPVRQALIRDLQSLQMRVNRWVKQYAGTRGVERAKRDATTYAFQQLGQVLKDEGASWRHNWSETAAVWPTLSSWSSLLLTRMDEIASVALAQSEEA